MLIRKPTDLAWSDVTPKAQYVRRREFMRAAAVPVVAGAAGWLASAPPAEAQGGLAKLTFTKSPLSTTGETLTPYGDITTYNNFYEFGIDKDSPSRFGKSLRPRPWTVTIDGAVAKGGPFAIDDLIKPYQLEERVYRLRCVEGWSMVIPWIGIPLGDILRKAEPTAKAKFVEFTTLNDPEQMPGVRRRSLDWPYVEGLRLDEAMHPLAILAVGPVRRGAAEPERRAAAAGRALEVRLQEHQVDRPHPPGREAARGLVGADRSRASTASTRT